MLPGVVLGGEPVEGSRAAPFPVLPGLFDDRSDGDEAFNFRPWRVVRKFRESRKFREENFGVIWGKRKMAAAVEERELGHASCLCPGLYTRGEQVELGDVELPAPREEHMRP